MVEWLINFFHGEMGKVGWVIEIFSRLKYFIVSKYFFYIIAVRFCLAHCFQSNLLNIMPRRGPVGEICQPFNSGGGSNDGLEFIRCDGGR